MGPPNNSLMLTRLASKVSVPGPPSSRQSTVKAQAAGQHSSRPFGALHVSGSHLVIFTAGGHYNRVMAIVEKAVLYALMALMAIVLILATLDLVWTIVLAVTTPPLPLRSSPRHAP